LPKLGIERSKGTTNFSCTKNLEFLKFNLKFSLKIFFGKEKLKADEARVVLMESQSMIDLHPNDLVND